MGEELKEQGEPDSFESLKMMNDLREFSEYVKVNEDSYDDRDV